MFLKESKTGDLVEVLNLIELTNPYQSRVTVSFQRGEEPGDPEPMHKSELTFPSGEHLPQCWLDGEYREEEIFRR